MDKYHVIAAGLAVIAVSLIGCGSDGGSCELASAQGLNPITMKPETVSITFKGISGDCCNAMKDAAQGKTYKQDACKGTTSITEQIQVNGGACSGTECSASMTTAKGTVKLGYYDVGDTSGDCCKALQVGGALSPACDSVDKFCYEETISIPGEGLQALKAKELAKEEGALDAKEAATPDEPAKGPAKEPAKEAAQPDKMVV